MCEVLSKIINSYKSPVLLSLADSPSSLAVNEIPEQLKGQDSAFPNTMVTHDPTFSSGLLQEDLSSTPYSKMKTQG